MNKVKEFFKNKKNILKLVIILIVISFIMLYFKIEFFKEVVNLLICSFILAYILRPLRDLIIGKRNISKRAATLIVIIGITSLFLLIIFVAVPSLIKELGNASPLINDLISDFNKLGDKMKVQSSPVFRTIYIQIEEKVWNFLMNFSNNTIQSLISMLENILSFAIIPVVSYYVLSDGDNISNKLSLIIPMEKRKITRVIFKDVNLLLERYIVSQIVLSLATGIMCLILFEILDIKFSIWLAIINGLFNIVPYFGAFFGGVPAVVISMLISPVKGVWCLIGIVIIQQIEGNLLAPKITAESTNIHPLIIIILLLIGEKISGISGMILVVPVGVIIKVLYDDLNYYLF